MRLSKRTISTKGWSIGFGRLKHPLLAIGECFVPGREDQLARHQHAGRIKVGLQLDPRLGLAGSADHARRVGIEQQSLRRFLAEQPAMQAPVAYLVRRRVAIAPFLDRVGVGIEAFVDHDPLLLEEDGAEDIGIEPDAGTRHTEQPVRVVELDADLQVLLDDIVDRDGRFDRDATRMSIFGQERPRVLFDGLVGHIGNELGH
jgi:hypothetical protein